MQVVVDAIPPQCLVSNCATREFDFQTTKEEELHDFTIPLDLPVGRALAKQGHHETRQFHVCSAWLATRLKHGSLAKLVRLRESTEHDMHTMKSAEPAWDLLNCLVGPLCRQHVCLGSL